MIPPELLSQTFGVAGVVVYLVYEIRRGVVADLRDEVADLRAELDATRTLARRNRVALRRLSDDGGSRPELPPGEPPALRGIDRNDG